MAAHQAPPSLGFSRQEYWTGVGCHFLLQCMKVKSENEVALLVTPWTAAYQAPPSMGFFRQEYWSGLKCKKKKVHQKKKITFSVIRVVASAYLRLLTFLLAILIPAYDSSSPGFHMMYPPYKLNKQGNNIQPCVLKSSNSLFQKYNL